MQSSPFDVPMIFKGSFCSRKCSTADVTGTSAIGCSVRAYLNSRELNDNSRRPSKISVLGILKCNSVVERSRVDWVIVFALNHEIGAGSPSLVCERGKLGAKEKDVLDTCVCSEKWFDRHGSICVKE